MQSVTVTQLQETAQYR